MSLEIRVSGQELDLFQSSKSSFYITKQLHDLRNLKTRESSYTKTIRVPNSERNLSIIGTNAPKLSKSSPTGVQFIPCEVLMDGVSIFQNGQIVVGLGDREGFSITIYDGVVGFFATLGERNIRDLDWSEFNIDWDLATVVGLTNATTGIVYSNSIWATNESYEIYVTEGGNAATEKQDFPQLRYSGLFLYVRTILDKILAEQPNLTFDFDLLGDTPDLDRSAIAIPINNFTSTAKADESTGVSNMEATRIKTFSAPSTAPITLPMVEVSKEGNIEFTIGTRSWDFTEASTVNVAMTFDLLPIWKNNQETIGFNSVSSVTVALRVDGNAIVWRTFNYWQFQNYPLVNRTITANNLTVAAGSKMSVTVSTVYRFFYVIAPPDVDMYDVAISQFLVKKIPDAQVQTIDFGTYVPDISQKDFVRAILQQFNLVVSENKRTVSFSRWEDIAKRNPINFEYEKDRGFTELATLTQYARTNKFQYENKNVATTQTEGQFENLSAATEDEKTVIKSKFSACDTSIIVGNSIAGRVLIPAFEIGISNVNLDSGLITFTGVNYVTSSPNILNVNDLLIISGVVHRVIDYADSNRGSLDSTPAVGSSFNYKIIRYKKGKFDKMHFCFMEDANDDWNIIDGNSSQAVTGTYKKATFKVEELGWGAVLEREYKTLVNTIATPYVFTAYFRIPLIAFLEIDQLRPFYIPSQATLFYINKIEQYRLNSLVRIELIQLGLPEVQPPEQNGVFSILNE